VEPVKDRINAGAIMKKHAWWKKLLAIGALSGAVLFQTPTCTEQAILTTAFTSTITAGGVLYLVNRVISD
jgi:hypothetical protein